MSLLLSFRGIAGSTTPADTTDIWSFGLWFDAVDNSNTDLSLSDANDLANDVAGDFTSTFDAYSPWPNNSFFTEARVYTYEFNLVLQPAVTIGISDPVVGTGGANSTHHPLESAVVVTFDTTDRSKPRSGRVYTPFCAFTLDSGSHISTSDMDTLLTDFAGFLGDVDGHVADAVGTDCELVVQSRTVSDTHWSGSHPGAKRTKPVTGLRGGLVVDTQRRRRNSQPEAYRSLAYP